MSAVVSPNPNSSRGATADEGLIASAIENVYAEADLPRPSLRYPITPLGPLLERMPILCKEMPALTTRSAEAYLLKRGSLIEPFEAGMATSEKLSGFLYATATVSCIMLCQEDPIVRRRFSLAHELGHLALHVPKYLAQQDETDTAAFHDLFTEIQAAGGETNQGSTDSLAEREGEADRFAAELLMPEEIVRAIAMRARQEGFHGAGQANRVAMELLVSRAAMWRRMTSLGLLSWEEPGELPSTPGPSEEY